MKARISKVVLTANNKNKNKMKKMKKMKVRTKENKNSKYKFSLYHSKVILDCRIQLKLQKIANKINKEKKKTSKANKSTKGMNKSRTQNVKKDIIGNSIKKVKKMRKKTIRIAKNKNYMMNRDPNNSKIVMKTKKTSLSNKMKKSMQHDSALLSVSFIFIYFNVKFII